MAEDEEQTQTKRRVSNPSSPPKGTTKRRKCDDDPQIASTSTETLDIGGPAEASTTAVPLLELPQEDVTSSGNNTLTPFYGAHGFILNNVVFGNPIINDPFSKIMEKVTEHIIDGAEYDSYARDPPPRCQEGTRESIRNAMDVWFGDEEREKKLLWLNGPAGAGKSAIMQTVADTAAPAGRLGAAVFFSQPNGRSDAHKLVPTLACQLALCLDEYRAYFVEQLTLNPRVFTKATGELFRRFIVEPFATKSIYRTGHTRYILLDGLDECGTRSDQCTIIELIAQFVLQYPTVPLLWVVASRQEDHLTNKFREPNAAASHWWLYVPIDNEEARRDVESFLRRSFEEVRQSFLDATTPDWPTEADFAVVAKRASGLFVFAATIKRFLEDPDIANPVSQLEIVISIINGVRHLPPEVHPFAALDALYTRIVAGIPIRARPIMELLVGHLLIRGDTLRNVAFKVSTPYTLVIVSNTLGFRAHEVYGAMHKLHSVLSIPSQKEAHRKNIRVLHASFSDFLRDPGRAKTFALDLMDLNTKLWKCYHRIMLQANQDPARPYPDPTAISLTWSPDVDVISGAFKKPMPFQQLLIYETVLFWGHYLFPGACPCISGEIFNPSAPEAESLVTPTERLHLLQELNWSKFAPGYFLDDGLHLRHIVDWIFRSWEDNSFDLTHHRIGKKVALQDFDLDLVDTNMAAYGRKPSAGQMRLYYSGTETSYGQIYWLSPIQALISEVSLLQDKYRNLKVILLGEKSRSALLVYPLDDELAFCFLPLKQYPEK